MNYSRIAGTGGYLPQKILSNADLEKMVDTSDDWIFSRTGIRERHIAAPGETTCDLSEQAALRAIAASTSSGNVLVVGDSAVLTATGSPWSLSTVGTTFGPLNAVTFTSPTHAIAVGNGGKIYSFTWGAP